MTEPLDLEDLIWAAWSDVCRADNRQERSMKLIDAMQESMSIPDDAEYAELKRLAVFMRWADAHCEQSVGVAVKTTAALLASHPVKEGTPNEQSCTYCGGVYPYPVELHHTEDECTKEREK